jgi:predicted nucleic acid-binding protein
MILIDSDVLIDALKSREPARARVARGLVEANVATTTINAFELYAGVRSEGEAASVDALLAVMTLVSIDHEIARLAGRVAHALAARGARIPAADALIAGACLLSGASLLTRNVRHFRRVPGLGLAAFD